MKKIITIISFCALGSLAACVSPSDYTIPGGSIFTSVTLNKDISSTADKGSKKGVACASSILSLVATGDASVKAAAANGQINTVNSVDFSYKSVLGSLYLKVCTIVNGN